MSERALASYSRLAGTTVAQPRSAKVGLWGMGLLIATEAALFASLIAGYFYLRWYSEGGWPPEGPDPALLRPTFYTAALALSSLTLLVAQAGIRRGNAGLLVAGLTTTLALGLTFVGLQAWDFAAKASDGIVPSAGTFDSINYVLTGAHAAHVVVGALILGWVLVRALRGAYSSDRQLGVTVASAYWHFVVILALIVYVTVVWSPRW